MSIGLECCFVERNFGEWYYLLENSTTPKNAYDWRDYANAYGPFKSQDLAHKDLIANHSSLDRFSVINYDHYSRLSVSQKESYEDLMKYPSCPVIAIDLFIYDH